MAIVIVGVVSHFTFNLMYVCMYVCMLQ